MKLKPSLSLSIGLVLLSAGCASSDKLFWANSAANYTYLESEYERLCVQAKGPDTCKTKQAALVELKRQLALADNVLHIGAMPAAEKKQLKAAQKAAQ